jgi:hypothetical protein
LTSERASSPNVTNFEDEDRVPAKKRAPSPTVTDFDEGRVPPKVTVTYSNRRKKRVAAAANAAERAALATSMHASSSRVGSSLAAPITPVRRRRLRAVQFISATRAALKEWLAAVPDIHPPTSSVGSLRQWLSLKMGEFLIQRTINTTHVHPENCVPSLIQSQS